MFNLKKFLKTPLSFLGAAGLALACANSAYAVPVSLTKLTGLAGGSPEGTAVYKASLDSIGLSSISSVSVSDVSGGFGGAAGQFSGFDLDALFLSNTDCATAACAEGLVGLSVFDYSPTGTFFTPGTQREPVDAKLFGTDASGLNVDNAVATLGVLDANSTTSVPPATGFVSMGDFGSISLNLTSAVSTSGLFLYIGEVGDNGEVVASSIEVRETSVSEPGTLGILAVGLGLLGLRARRRS